MMRARSAMAVAMAGLVAAACDTQDADTTPGLVQDETVQERQQDVIVARANFEATPQAEGLNVSGWAEFRQQGATWQDGLDMRVHVMGLGEGPHAWHIHQGTCESPGQVVLPLSDFGDQSGIASDLNPGSEGMVEEQVSIDRDRVAGLNLQQDHVIAIHMRGSDNPGPVIACAPIEMGATGAGMQQPGMGTHPGMQPGQPGQPGTQPGQPGQPGTQGTTGY
jgi:Cu/Zn superoxide dismutase